MRVLHLTSGPPGFQAEYAQQAIARELGAEFDLIARQLGRPRTGRNMICSFWWLRRSHDFDVVHAWDFASARLAAAARRRVIFSLSGDLQSVEMSWLKWLARHRDLQIVCPTRAHHQRLSRSGLPDRQLKTALLPAQVSAVTDRDEKLRQSLGLMLEDRVLLAPGESVRSAGHHYALWAASILHVLDPRWRLLVWGRGPQVQALQRLSEKFDQPRVLCVAGERLGRSTPFEELLRAADIALITPSGPAPPLPIQMCLAAGLPIVASASPVTDEFLRDQENAAVVPRLSPRLLAQRVLALREDEEGRRKFGANARMNQHGTSSRFIELYRGLYRSVQAVAHR
jgi:glycosyltransferase involved in cell wall biosynthesis